MKLYFISSNKYLYLFKKIRFPVFTEGLEDSRGTPRPPPPLPRAPHPPQRGGGSSDPAEARESEAGERGGQD